MYFCVCIYHLAHQQTNTIFFLKIIYWFALTVDELSNDDLHELDPFSDHLPSLSSNSFSVNCTVIITFAMKFLLYLYKAEVYQKK